MANFTYSEQDDLLSFRSEDKGISSNIGKCKYVCLNKLSRILSPYVSSSLSTIAIITTLPPPLILAIRLNARTRSTKPNKRNLRIPKDRSAAVVGVLLFRLKFRNTVRITKSV